VVVEGSSGLRISMRGGSPEGMDSMEMLRKGAAIRKETRVCLLDLI